MDPRLVADGFWPRLEAAFAAIDADEQAPPAEARVGAVLVLIEDTPAGPQVILTRRRHDMRSHPGQVSFAGGRLDPGETIEQAALREAQEEIALDPSTVEVIGIGTSFYIPPSRFWVVPVVGRWRSPHPLSENPWEVDAVLHVPLSHLVDRANWRHTPLSLRGSVWAWQLDDDLLWGATAIVMARILDIAVPGWNDGIDPADLGDERSVRPWETAPSWQRRALLVGDLPAVPQRDVAHVTEAQTRAVRAWLDERGVDALARAEQAGRALAHAVRRFREGDVRRLGVTVLAGPSSNGAAGFAAARLLAAAGADVEVLSVGPTRYPAQAALLRDAGVHVEQIDAPQLTDTRSPGEVVIDAVLGIGAEPPLRDLPAAAAAWLQRHDVPVIAADLPSGIGADDGLRGPCIAADVTVAFGAPTVGIEQPIVQAYLGDLYLADLGIPAAAWKAAGVTPPEVFHRGPLVRLTDAA